MKLAKLNDGPEIFYTIQGEGSSMGRPAIFVRLSNCNLHCSWCDTPYTWNWTNTPFTHDDNVKYDHKTEQVTLQPRDVAEVIRTVAPSCRRVVFTGGEPLLQQRALVEVMRALNGVGGSSLNPYFFEVETNGTVVPTTETSLWVNQFNVSPKLANSNNPLHLRDKEKAMTLFAACAKQSSHATVVFKFVVSDDEGADLREIHALVTKYGINPGSVYIMPEGRTPEIVQRRALSLVEVCKDFGFNFSTRLHVLIWGALKGV